MRYIFLKNIRPDGKEYNGEWKAGKENGIGVLIEGFGEAPKKGRWEDGIMIEEIKDEDNKELDNNEADQNNQENGAAEGEEANN